MHGKFESAYKYFSRCKMRFREGNVLFALSSNGAQIRHVLIFLDNFCDMLLISTETNFDIFFLCVEKQE